MRQTFKDHGESDLQVAIMRAEHIGDDEEVRRLKEKIKIQVKTIRWR